MPIHKRFDRLPAEYQEVEYIESTGTQWIDTGITIDNDLDLRIDGKILISATQVGQYPRVFGGRRYRGSSDDEAIMLGFTKAWYGKIGTNETQLFALLPNNVYIFSLNKQHLMLSGVEYPMNQVAESLVVNTPIILFAELQEVTSETTKIINYGSFALFNLKIYDNAVLVRNFVPCYRKSDNEIGLYDLVTKTFYTNQGTGEFLKGANVYPTPKIAAIYKGDVKIGKVYKGNTLIYSSRALPVEYQEVEFVYPIDQGVNQLDFGIIWSDIKRIKCGLRSPSTEANTMLFNTSNRQRPWIAISRQEDVNIISSNPSLSSLTNMTKNDLDIVLSTSSQAKITTRGWGDSWDKQIEYYYVKFYDENDVLLGNFVPCYRKSDGKCGFYDLVSKTFTWHDNFEKGPDVN